EQEGEGTSDSEDGSEDVMEDSDESPEFLAPECALWSVIFAP
ncbi:hypothetical protein L195_g063504, partial [Trifolium pratense]